MNFEEFARDSGKALADATAALRPPSITEISSRRRRSTLTAGAVVGAVLLVGVVAVAGAINRSGTTATPATIPTETTMGAVEASVNTIDLLDGSRLEVVGPSDLVLTSYLFVLDRSELGGETNVYVTRTDEPAEAAAIESAEFEADLGSGVQLWRGDREGQPLFMSVDLDGWIVFLHVGSDAPPNSEDLLALAEELRGEVTEHGVILPNHDTETFTTYLGSPGTENSLHLGIGECIQELIPDSEIVEDPTRGEVVRGDSYASWCDEANNLEVRVHGDGGFVLHSVGGLRLSRTYPASQPTTTSTSVPLTTQSTSPAPTEPTVSSIPIDQDVSLRVLAVRPNNPSLAVLDLTERTTTIYPPGAHAMPRDATDGAVATPDRDWIIWTNGVATLFTGALGEASAELGPNPPREISFYAPALRVVPTPDSDRAWLVQPGLTAGADDHPTLVDLVRVSDGSTLLRAEAEGSAFPVAATDTGLVLNVHDWFDTGDGFVTEPGTELVVHMLEDGTTVPLGEGRAIAASPTRVIRIVSNRLLISGPDGSGEVEVVMPFDGTWMEVGGPMIPSDAMPLQTVSPDGSEVLVRLGRELDANSTPADSELLAVNLSDGTTRRIAESNGATPLATWSSDGQWIALFWRNDITLVNSAETETQILLEDVIPEDHFPLAAG